MRMIAILTMIVITFAMIVGAAIGLVCGHVFGDMFGGNDTTSIDTTGNATSWFGGAIASLLNYTGAAELVALPAGVREHPLEKLTLRLFSAHSDIDWGAADISNPNPELVEKLYKLYSTKQQRVQESLDNDTDTDTDTSAHNNTNIDTTTCGCDVKAQTKAGFIVECLRNAGVSVDGAPDADLIQHTTVYADVGAGDCKLTLAIAKAIHASKIYNIDVANYCPDVGAVNYIDGSIDERIEIPDDSVDVVTMIYSLHHMADYKHKVAEAKRILKSSGVLLVQDHVIDQNINSNNDATKRMIELQHCLHMINSMASNTNNVILEYNEFKRVIEQYLLNTSLELFTRAQIDELFGHDFTLLNFDMRRGDNYDATFIATYKKI